MTEPKPLYGWWSDQHAQAYPGQVCIYLTPEGKEVLVTQVQASDSEPDNYYWTDARCLGPVTELIKPRRIEGTLFYSWNIPPAPVSKVKEPPRPNWLKQALAKFRELTGNSQ
jgi:hypothetical protein